jgi:hypothetical protein
MDRITKDKPQGIGKGLLLTLSRLAGEIYFSLEKCHMC